MRLLKEEKDILTEDRLDQCRNDANSICRYIDKNGMGVWYDLIDYDMYPMNTSKVSFQVQGDWKHDHARFTNLVYDWAEENDRNIFKIDTEYSDDGDSDNYTAQYDVFITADKDSFDKLNSMRGLFSEGLNAREKQIYIDSVNEAEDIDDLKEIVHEIYWYDKALFVKINKFPPDRDFEEIKANILKNLGAVDESLTEDRSLAKPFKKELKNAYKSFDASRDSVRKKNDAVIKTWNQAADGIPMDDNAKNILLKPEPKFSRFKPDRSNSLEREEYPFYVTYYEETPYYHPEEGGYYVAGRQAIMSKGFDNKEDALKFAREAADKFGFERVDDTWYHLGSRYIGEDDSVRVETKKEYLSREEGDSVYESLTEELSTEAKRNALDRINTEGGYAAYDLEDAAMKYQPDAKNLNDLTDDTVEKVYTDLKNDFLNKLKVYGDDADLDGVLYDVFGVNESLNEAKMWGRNYRYDVVYYTTKRVLYGTTNDLADAENMVIRAVKHIKDNPWTSVSDKISMIDSIDIEDTENRNTCAITQKAVKYKLSVLDRLEDMNESLNEDSTGLTKQERLADWDELVSICYGYDPFIQYIENGSQQLSAEKANQERNQKFDAIMRKHNLKSNGVPFECTNKRTKEEVARALKAWVENSDSLTEDTIKTKDGKWTNKGDEGTHGKFNTKKEADAQRRAMFANGFKENLKESIHDWPVVIDNTHIQLPISENELIYFIETNFLKNKYNIDFIDEVKLVTSGVDEANRKYYNLKVSGFLKRENKMFKVPVRVWENGDIEDSRNPLPPVENVIDESLNESAVWVDGNGKEIQRPMSSFGEPNVDYSLISKQAKDYKEKQNIIRNLIQTYDQVKIQGMSPIVALIRDNAGNTIYRFDFLEKNKDFEDQIAEFKSLVGKGLKESSDKWAVVDDNSGDILDVFYSKDEAKASAAETQGLRDSGMYRQHRGPFVVEPYYESLKESAAMDTAKKLEDDGWTVLSNVIRGGDMKHYWLARKMNKERGKADWKAIDDETGNVIDISYDQALGREPIGVSSGVSKLSKQLGKMLLPKDESLKESSSSLEKEIYDMLNDMGGYTDYQGRIDAVADEFNISKDEAEGYVCNWIQFYNEESDMDESLKEDIPVVAGNNTKFTFDNDFINYNDFLSDNFDGWSDDIDYLIKDLNKCARALRTSANKLVFYKDYDEDFYAIDDISTVVDYIAEDYSMYELSGTGIKFIVCVDLSVPFWIFKNEQEGDRVVNSVKSYVSSLNEDFKLEGLVDIHDDFQFARENWKKLVPDVDFDIALERWNKESKLAEPVHWYAKPLYSAKAWDDMVQMFQKTDIPKIEEPEELDIDDSDDSEISFNDDFDAEPEE